MVILPDAIYIILESVDNYGFVDEAPGSTSVAPFAFDACLGNNDEPLSTGSKYTW
jgi:hypothetical protein